MSQTSTPPTPPAPTQPPSSRRRSPAVIGLLLVAILSLGFAGYTALNPHSMTVTQQQLLTQTQSLYNTQTVTTVRSATAFSTVTSTTTGMVSYTYSQTCAYYGCGSAPPWNYYGYPGYVYPGYDPYGNFYPPCQPMNSNNTVQCVGYIDQNQNGCMVLVIPISNPYIAENLVYQYYTLQHLPASVPPTGTLVTVKGQMYQGYNASPSGAACPGNYINVASISQ